MCLSSVTSWYVPERAVELLLVLRALRGDARPRRTPTCVEVIHDGEAEPPPRRRRGCLQRVQHAPSRLATATPPCRGPARRTLVQTRDALDFRGQEVAERAASPSIVSSEAPAAPPDARRWSAIDRLSSRLRRSPTRDELRSIAPFSSSYRTQSSSLPGTRTSFRWRPNRMERGHARAGDCSRRVA